MCVGQLYDTADLFLQCNRDSVRVIHNPRAAHSKAVNNSQAMSTRMVHMAGCSALISDARAHMFFNAPKAQTCLREGLQRLVDVSSFTSNYLEEALLVVKIVFVRNDPCGGRG